jgi:hypothetical protein
LEVSYWYDDTTGQSGDNVSVLPQASPYQTLPQTSTPSYPVSGGASPVAPSGGPSPAPSSNGINPMVLAALASRSGAPSSSGFGAIAGPTTPGSNPFSTLGIGSELGSLLSSILGPSFGLNSSGAGSTGGTFGGIAGGAIGSIFGPFGTLAGSTLGDLLGSIIGNWVGGGLNKFAKPEGVVNTLEGSGNPIESLLGQYIQTSGIGQGFDLSGSGPENFNWPREADVLQLLSGEALPKNVFATGDFKNPVDLTGWKNLSQLQQSEPGATNLNLNQLQQIQNLIATLVNRSGGMNLKGLLGEENTLASKLKAAEQY